MNVCTAQDLYDKPLSCLGLRFLAAVRRRPAEHQLDRRLFIYGGLASALENLRKIEKICIEDK